MKKITFLMLHLNYGGLEKQTITLINELAKDEDYDIEIISVYDLLSGKSFYKIDDRVKVTFLARFGPDHKKIKEAKEKFDILSLIKYLALGIKCVYYKSVKLKSVIAKLDTDIIVSTRIEFAKLIKRKDTLNITQEHSYINDPKYIKKVRKSFKNIKYAIVMTNKAKESYESWLANESKRPEIVVIPNMIEKLEENKKASFGKKNLISVGRLEEEKDFKSLIDVFKIVNERCSDASLKIVGEGTKRHELEAYAKTMGLSDKIIFTGRLTEESINNLLAESSVFILTSLSESFSLVILEAMRAGLPVVSFDIETGPRELITNRENGILVENRDKAKMAEEILDLLEAEPKWERISENSLKYVSRFYSFNVKDEWKKLFEGVNV